MIKVNGNVNVKFNDDVMFATKDELRKMYRETGTENLDEVAENLDAIGYVSASIGSLGGDGYLFIF